MKEMLKFLSRQAVEIHYSISYPSACIIIITIITAIATSCIIKVYYLTNIYAAPSFINFALKHRL